jgi:hypothetical protein
VLSVAAAAPHIGQFKVSAGMTPAQMKAGAAVSLFLATAPIVNPNPNPNLNHCKTSIDLVIRR